jgi:phosphoribosylaminoimidazole-succinocarboxamide synthase
MAVETLNRPPDQAIGSIEEIFPHIKQEYSVYQGKVRDIVDLGDRLLVMASDRISVFDVVLPTLIPGKGIVLTEMSNKWREFLGEPTDLIASDIREFPNEFQDERLIGRTNIVKKRKVASVECIGRIHNQLGKNTKKPVPLFHIICHTEL